MTTLHAILAKAVQVKDAILEATDEIHELDELLDGYPKTIPGGNARPGSLVRSAKKSSRDADKLMLEALDEYMHVLACLEQALTNEPTILFVCDGCGSTVRVTEKLAEGVKQPICVACHGELAKCVL